MKNQTILIAVVILLVAIIGGYALSKTEYYDSLTTKRHGNKETIKTEDPPETMTSEMHGIHNMEVLTEQKFLQGMIPHHQEAVDSAMTIITRSENPEVKKLAEAIVTAQEKEIADMKSWHMTWYNEAYTANDSYTPMMPDLSTLSGKELDQAFLEGMIEHHMGALMMAQQVSPNIEHQEIAALAQAIAETQSAEIITMRILLKQVK